jgi:hypothetical protein
MRLDRRSVSSPENTLGRNTASSDSTAPIRDGMNDVNAKIEVRTIQ